MFYFNVTAAGAAVLRFPPMRFGPAFSSPAFSTPAIWSHVFQSCIFQSRVFSIPHARHYFRNSIAVNSSHIASRTDSDLRASHRARLLKRSSYKPQSIVITFLSPVFIVSVSTVTSLESVYRVGQKSEILFNYVNNITPYELMDTFITFAINNSQFKCVHLFELKTF